MKSTCVDLGRALKPSRLPRGERWDRKLRLWGKLGNIWRWVLGNNAWKTGQLKLITNSSCVSGPGRSCFCSKNIVILQTGRIKSCLHFQACSVEIKRCQCSISLKIGLVLRAELVIKQRGVTAGSLLLRPFVWISPTLVIQWDLNGAQVLYIFAPRGEIALETWGWVRNAAIPMLLQWRFQQVNFLLSGEISGVKTIRNGWIATSASFVRCWGGWGLPDQRGDARGSEKRWWRQRNWRRGAVWTS